MRENLMSKLATYLDPLLEVPSAEKYHWRFVLILNPRYVIQLTDIRKLHKIKTVGTRTFINEIMPKFYYYIVAAELVENPYTAPPAMTKVNRSLYFNEDTVG